MQSTNESDSACAALRLAIRYAGVALRWPMIVAGSIGLALALRFRAPAIMGASIIVIAASFVLQGFPNMHAGSLLVSTLLATLQSGYLAGLVIAPLLRLTLPDVDGTGTGLAISAPAHPCSHEVSSNRMTAKRVQSRIVISSNTDQFCT